MQRTKYRPQTGRRLEGQGQVFAVSGQVVGLRSEPWSQQCSELPPGRKDEGGEASRKKPNWFRNGDQSAFVQVGMAAASARGGPRTLPRGKSTREGSEARGSAEETVLTLQTSPGGRGSGPEVVQGPAEQTNRKCWRSRYRWGAGMHSPGGEAGAGDSGLALQTQLGDKLAAEHAGQRVPRRRGGLCTSSSWPPGKCSAQSPGPCSDGDPLAPSAAAAAAEAHPWRNTRAA